MKNIRLILTVCVLAMVLLFADLAWADTAPEEIAYTVDFYYGDAEYHLPGGGSMPLSRLLDALNIDQDTAEITDVSFTDDTLLSITPEGGDYLLTSLRAFDSEEALNIAFSDDYYHITVLDGTVTHSGGNKREEIEGVTQGENKQNFTSELPLATIWINEAVIQNSRDNAVPTYSTDSYITNENGNFRYPGDNWTQLNLSEYFRGKHISFPDDNTIINVGDIKIDGPIVGYRIENAGSIHDANTGNDKSLDFIVTYSNLNIAFQSNMTGRDWNKTFKNSNGDAILSLFSGNMIGTATNSVWGNNNNRLGIRVDVKIQAVFSGTDNVVDGTFYFPMVDLDVQKMTVPGFGYVTDSNKYYNYSEGVIINSGLASNVFIPGKDPTSPYKSAIEKTSDGKLYIHAAENGSDIDPGTFDTGFAALVNNKEGLNLTWIGVGGGHNNYIQTVLLYGAETIDYRLKSTTDDGGNIQTTQLGNKSGRLDDGADVYGPTTINTAKGQTVVYTMTPEKGYRIKSVTVGSGTLDYNENGKTQDVTADVKENLNYNNNGDPYYTYTFVNIDSDNAIHVEWERIDLTITKTVPGTDNDTFTFRIKLEDPQQKMVSYRVKAWKTVNTFNKVNDQEANTPYLAYDPVDNTFMGWDFSTGKWKTPLSMADASTNYAFTDEYKWTLRDGTRGPLTDIVSVRDNTKWMKRLNNDPGNNHRVIVGNNYAPGWDNANYKYVFKWKVDSFYWLEETNVNAGARDYSKIEFYTYSTETKYYNFSDNNSDNNPEYKEIAGAPGTYIITVPSTDSFSPTRPDGYDNDHYECTRIAPQPFDLDAHITGKTNQRLTPVNGETGVYQFTLQGNETLKLEGVIPYGWTYTIWEVNKDGKKVELNKTFLAEGNKQWRLTKEENVQGTMDDENVAATFINEPLTELTNITVEKKWYDANNKDGIRPADVTVELLANGVATGKTLTLNAANAWGGVFSDLKGGNKITYTVQEQPVLGYTAAVTVNANTGFEVINTRVRNITVKKVWDHTGNTGTLPDSVTVHLHADGVEKVKIELNAANSWTATFKDLPKYNASKEIIYTVTETVPKDYSMFQQGEGTDNVTITNKYTPGKTSVAVLKHWDDGHDQDGLRPASVTVELLADGVPTGKTLTLDAAGAWGGIFEDLDDMKDGQDIVYTVQETNVPTGYAATVTGSADTRFEITNTQIQDITVTKVWKDDNAPEGLRPHAIKVTLLADGEECEVQEIEPDADGNWTHTFKDMPKYKGGKEITYTVKEHEHDNSEKYTSTVTGDVKQGFTITNTYITKPEPQPPTPYYPDEPGGFTNCGPYRLHHVLS